MNLVCRFCIAAYGIKGSDVQNWPTDYEQWELFKKDHIHSRFEILRLAKRTSLPRSLVESWTREPIPIATLQSAQPPIQTFDSLISGESKNSPTGENENG